MKRIADFFVALTGVLFLFSSVAGATPKEIYVVTDMSSIGQYPPLQNFVAALKKHPKQRMFRVVWWTSGSSGMYTHTIALYDRQKQTLKYHDISNFVARDMDDNRSAIWKKEAKTTLYSNVTDAMIYRLNRNEELWDNNLAIERLVSLGSKKRHLNYVTYFETFEDGKLVRVKTLPPIQ